VSQRCLEDFSTSRLHSIARVSLVLGSMALFLTTLGILLGMVWAKIEWGRYWSWDSKEIGGLSVVVWLTCYLVAHYFFKNSARGVLAISMLGNIVVSSGFRDRRTAGYATRPAVALRDMVGKQWPASFSLSEGRSLGKVLPPRFLGVGQT